MDCVGLSHCCNLKIRLRDPKLFVADRKKFIILLFAKIDGRIGEPET